MASYFAVDPDWVGQLVLAAFDGAAQSGLSAAASLAGAASLTVDSDATSVKAHFRDGAFDFVVNTLDEALRAIKNQVRQGQPIAIGLMAEPEVVLVEAEARGLAASFVLGASTLVSKEYEAWLAERRWFAAEFAASDVRSYSDLLPDDDALRRRWLRQLPTYQRSVRLGARWAWVSAEELTSFPSR